MKYVAEFQNGTLAEELARRIRRTAPLRDITLMEVCGTHTMAIHRYGLKSLLPENIRLLSGPGCPVCVTSKPFIDRAIAIAAEPKVTVATFGDMFKVPGSYSSLAKEKAAGRDIRILYSAEDAVFLARTLPERKIVFLGVGFETTAPTIAASLLEAEGCGLTNLFCLSALKTLPEALKAIVNTPELGLDGFILPGHLSTVTGTGLYEFLPREHGTACVVTGFEPLDILQGILMLSSQISTGKLSVEIQYRRSVRPEGNPRAIEIMGNVLEPCDSEWRGIGTIPGSGLRLKERFSHLDAHQAFQVTLPEPRENPGCICGLILQGLKTPLDCRLYKRICTPENPIGACMVSSEGTCAAYYKYVGEA